MRSAFDVFSAALDLPDADRLAFLDATCAGDPALRAEVEDLLGAHAPAAALFQHVAESLHAGGALERLAEREIGRQIGPWRITHFLASGGMGSVYLAERADQDFRQQAALKLIAPGLGTRAILARFAQERQALAALTHASIARLIDGGSTPDGTPYLVMEYVDGIPIDRYCATRALDTRERLALFLAVCEAVQHAHAHLVIHRDIKPGNILVDGSGQVKLLDFGLATIVRTGEGGAAPATLTPALTPRYASPEQVRGAPLTTATDVYSLAVVLYELLTEARPYALDGKSAAEIERAICEGEPLPLTRPGRRVDRDLECIVLRGMSKEPARRYATVGDLAADVRRYLANEPVHARPDTPLYRLGRFSRRNRLAVASAAAIVATLAVAFGVTLRAYHEAAARQREMRTLAYTSALSAAESSILAGRIGEAGAHLAAAPAALRSWEWRHLRARLDRARASWPAHASAITDLAVSRDGRWAVTASLDSLVRAWSTDTGRALRAWGPLPSSVESDAILPDGRVVAGLSDGRVVLLSATGGAIDTLPAPGAPWAMVDASPDGRQVAAGFFDGSVCVWDAHSHARLAQLRVGPLAQVAYAPTGAYFVCGDASGHTSMWDARTFRRLQSLPAHEKRVYAIAISRDGRRVATGSMDRTAHVWDVATRTLLCTFRGHDATVTALAFDQTGNRVVSAGADGRLLVWDAAQGAVRAELRGHAGDVSAVCATPDGTRFVTADWGGSARVWDSDADDVRVLRAPSEASMVSRILASALDASGTHVLVGTTQKEIADLTLRGGIARIAAVPDTPSGVGFADGGRAALASTGGGLLKLHDATTGALVRTVAAGQGAITALAVDEAGSIAVTIGADSSVCVWRLPAIRRLARVDNGGGRPASVSLTPDGRFAAYGLDAGTVVVRRLDGAGPVRSWTAEDDGLTVVCLSADGCWVASGSKGGMVRIFRVADGSLRAATRIGSVPVNTLAFSRDGTRLAVGSATIVHVLDAVSGQYLVALHGHVARLTALAFAPHDAALLSSSADGTVRVWDAPPADPTDRSSTSPSPR